MFVPIKKKTFGGIDVNPNKPNKWEERGKKMEELGNKMQKAGGMMVGIGCLLTLLVTIPLFIIFLFLL